VCKRDTAGRDANSRGLRQPPANATGKFLMRRAEIRSRRCRAVN